MDVGSLPLGLGNSGHSAEAVAKGIGKLLSALKSKLSDTQLLLLGVFPRDAMPGGSVRPISSS